MRYFIFMIFLVTAACLLAIFVFSEGMRWQILNSFHQLTPEIKNPATGTVPVIGGVQDGTDDAGAVATNTPGSSTPNSSSSQSQGFFPAGFKGPTGPPHIIGPSGPPPNY